MNVIGSSEHPWQSFENSKGLQWVDTDATPVYVYVYLAP